MQYSNYLDVMVRINKGVNIQEGIEKFQQFVFSSKVVSGRYSIQKRAIQKNKRVA